MCGYPSLWEAARDFRPLKSVLGSVAPSRRGESGEGETRLTQPGRRRLQGHVAAVVKSLMMTIVRETHTEGRSPSSHQRCSKWSPETETWSEA